MKKKVILLVFVAQVAVAQRAVDVPMFYQRWANAPKNVKSDLLRLDPQLEKDNEEMLAKYKRYKSDFPVEFRSFILKKAKLIADQWKSRRRSIDPDRLLELAEFQAVSDFDLYQKGHLRDDGGVKSPNEFFWETRDIEMEIGLARLRRNRVSIAVHHDFGDSSDTGFLRSKFELEDAVFDLAEDLADAGLVDPKDASENIELRATIYNQVKWDFIIDDILGVGHDDPVGYILTRTPETSIAMSFLKRKKADWNEEAQTLDDISSIVNPLREITADASEVIPAKPTKGRR